MRNNSPSRASRSRSGRTSGPENEVKQTHWLGDFANSRRPPGLSRGRNYRACGQYGGWRESRSSHDKIVRLCLEPLRSAPLSEIQLAILSQNHSRRISAGRDVGEQRRDIGEMVPSAGTPLSSGSSHAVVPPVPPPTSRIRNGWRADASGQCHVIPRRRFGLK